MKRVCLGMIQIKNKSDCNGCMACYNICPTNAINMKSDIEGFWYPCVDGEKCIKCKKCIHTCPVINYSANSKFVKESCIYKKAFALKYNDEAVRSRSSSGGAFFAIAQTIISMGGYVVGAAFDEYYGVRHILVNSVGSLHEVMGSKYAQSNIGLIYKQIERLLKAGSLLLFVGTSCQVEGLKGYLKRQYEGLICVDLICMGIPSPGLWNRYLSAYFDRDNIESINFKDKTKGWHRFCISVKSKLNHGEDFLEDGADNYYMESMLKGYSLRPSCFKCDFKNEYKMADITIADCWGCETYLPELDDNKGLSMVIVHSEIGMKTLEKLRKINDIEIVEFDYAEVLEYNSNYDKCAKPNRYRSVFWNVSNRISLRFAFAVMCKNPGKYLIRKLKNKLNVR